MPRGIPNKKKEDVKPTATTNEVVEAAKPEKAPAASEPAKPKLEPLAVGQAYFEAPDGTIIIGDETKNEIWYRAGNGGKGMFINKKR